MNLTEEERQDIANRTAVALACQARARWIDSETHAEHHAWVEACIDKEKERAEFRKKVIQSGLAAVIPLLVVWGAHQLWEAFKEAVHR